MQSRSVRDSKTLLLIKPHPHETRHEVGVFLTEYFEDLINVEIPPNVDDPRASLV